MGKTIFFLLLVFGPASTYAQNDTVRGKYIDPVIVTANKFPQKQSTTGKVISVITKEQLEKNSGKTVSQLLNEQAGITINGALNNMGSVQTVYMRGASSGRTLVLLDGIPVNDPSMINNEFDLNLFAVENVERIEICKGAQSTLYGSDAVAGVINIITLNADVKKPINVKATLSGGSYGTAKGSAQLYGNQGKFAYSARFATLRTDGFSAANDSTGLNNYDRDGFKGKVTNVQAKYQATEQLSFRSFLMYSQYKAAIDAGVFTDEKDYTINNSSLTTGTGFNFKKDFFTLTGTYQYSELKRSYFNDSAFKTATIFEDNQYYGKSQFVEIYAAINLGSGFTLMQGADYRYSSYNQQYRSVSGFGPYNSNFNDTSLNQSGLYASVTYAGLGKKLNVEAGGRINTHSRYGSNATYTINPSYALAEHVRIFGSVATGFKAPTLYQLSLNPTLQPEQSVNYEAGLQYMTKNLSARLVYFDRKIKNGIDYNYITFNYFNYIKQLVKGVEYEFSLRPVEQVHISANYTWLSPRETTQNRLTNQDTVTYSYLLRRPKHNVNVSVEVQVTKKMLVTLIGKYVSSRFDVGGYAKKDVVLKGYFIAGAYAEYGLNDRVKFFADAQNVLNEKFFDVRGYNSLPVMLNAGVSFKMQ